MIVISQKESGAIYVDGVSFGFSEDMKAAIVDGIYVEIYRENLSLKEVRKTHYSKFKKSDGSGFNSAIEVKEYFDSFEGLRKKTTIEIQPNSELITNIDYDKLINLFIEESIGELKIQATGTIDPDNVTNQEALLIDGNLSNLCYNISSTGTNNKSLPAIQLPTNSGVEVIKLHWWNNNYNAANYKLQGSNDGTTWSDIQSGLSATGVVGTSANPQSINVNDSFIYYRMLCVQGVNGTYVVLSEIEAFKSAGKVMVNAFTTTKSIEISEQNGKIKLINNENQILKTELNHF